MTLRTLNYGNYGIFLIMGNAGFCPSAVVKDSLKAQPSFTFTAGETPTSPGLSKFPRSLAGKAHPPYSGKQVMT